MVNRFRIGEKIVLNQDLAAKKGAIAIVYGYSPIVNYDPEESNYRYWVYVTWTPSVNKQMDGGYYQEIFDHLERDWDE